MLNWFIAKVILSTLLFYFLAIFQPWKHHFSPYIHQNVLVYLLHFHYSLCSINRTVCMKERTNCLLTGLLQGTLMNIGNFISTFMVYPFTSDCHWCYFYNRLLHRHLKVLLGTTNNSSQHKIYTCTALIHCKISIFRGTFTTSHLMATDS